MFTARRPEARFALRLTLAFGVWSIVALGLLPLVSRLVVPTAAWVLALLEPHGAQVVFVSRYPVVAWQTTIHNLVQAESLSCRLLTYNLVLYLSLLTAIPGWSPWHRLALAAAGVPALLAFQVADLMLAVESRLLTVLRPEAYAFWRAFDPWFVIVKAYGSFSALGLRQVLPVLLLWLQGRDHRGARA